MEPKPGERHRVVIETEFENPWIGKNGGGQIGEAQYAIPNAKVGEVYDVRVISVGLNPWTRKRQAKLEILERPAGGERAVEKPRGPELTVDFASAESLARFGPGFRHVGDHYILVKRRPWAELEADEQQLWTAQGIQRLRGFTSGVRVTHAGTPHRNRLLHGFWHINARDEVVIVFRHEGERDGTVVMVEVSPRPGDEEAIAWFCQECGTELYRRSFASARAGEPLFDATLENEAITAFNADRALRTCNGCGTLHPLGFRFPAEHNTPEEEAARGTW
jgi:hypothetical protein